MAATLPVFLKHTFIGKSSQGQAYTARAHSRYIQRESATHAVYTHLMPENYNARQRWFFDHENGLRRNGRVIDKFVISVPHQISQEHAAETLMRFGKWLGQDQAPFMFTLQGFDSPNHHAHFVYIDIGQDGRRIYGTTQRNSTRGIKLEWERVANDTFAELGYDIRIQVKDTHELQAENDNVQERALDAEKVALDVETVPDMEAESVDANAPISTDEYVEVPGELPTVDVDESTEDAHQGDDEMATIERIPDDRISLAGNDIRLLASTVTELNRLRDAVQRIDEARERYASLVQQRERASLEAGVYEVQSAPILQSAYAAQERLTRYQKSNGKLKGVGFKLFGYELKTGARKQAENALREAEMRKAQAAYAEQTRKDYGHTVEVLSAQATAAEREAFMAQNNLHATYGTDADIDRARQAFENTVLKVVGTLTPQQAEESFLAVEITHEEYQAYLEQLGDERRLAEFLEVRDEYQITDDGIDI